MATTPRSGGPARSRPAAQSSRHSCCAQARSSLRRKRPQKAPSRHQISTPPAFNPTEPDRDYRGKPPTHAEGETMSAAAPSFENDINPLFRESDRAAMLGVFDLWSFDDVTANAASILAAL